MNSRHEDRTSIVLGDRIAGRYEIIKPLGKGGMGQVFLVCDLRLGRKLRAVKLLRPAEGMAAQADAELRMLLAVNHPRLPQIVDYVPPVGARPAALVTDYAEGENLAVWFERRGRRIEPLKAVGIARQLCEALAYLHELTPPIVHRDMKPANVMIDGVGFVRLIDLGIARLMKPGSGRDTQHLGTPGYAAPEQEDPHGLSDARTDLYGLGALLFYLLSGGRSPAVSGSDGQAMHDDLPAGLQSLVSCLLHRAPARRPASARDVDRLLAAIQGAASADAIAHAKEDAHAGTSARGARTWRENSHTDIGLGSGTASKASPSSVQASNVGTIRVIAVASYAPGAGATFLAVTLSRLLAARGVPCALVEHPLLEPQLFAMLSSHTGAGTYAGARDYYPPLDQRYVALRSASVIVHALHPDQQLPAGSERSEAALSRLRLQDLRAMQIPQPAAPATRSPVCVVDLSSAWQDDAAYELAAGCDEWIIAADPHVARWTPRRAAAWRQIAQERNRRAVGGTKGGASHSLWLANQDSQFAGRREWLQHMPQKPIASVPLLPASEWRALQYANRWATDVPEWRRTLEDALLPVLSRF